jgi:hypothetical protein
MTTSRDGLIQKIQGLLAKTVVAGCTEPEALSALDMAQALMAAHEITEDELKLTKEEKAILRKEAPGTLDPHNIKFRLMESVAKFCGCRAWQTRSRTEKIVEFCGLPSDARYASWLLDSQSAFVLAQLTDHLMVKLPPRGERRKVTNSFVQGICERISEKLESLCEKSAAAATSNGRELMVIKDALITAKMKAEKIHVSGQCLGGQGDQGSYGAGRAAGERASFARPVTGSNGALRIR